MKNYQITENNITYNVFEYDNGDKLWYLNGKPNRENGPAVEYVSGYKVWYKNGLCHRDNGPAVERINGKNDYWYNGKRLENINSDEGLIRYIKLLSIF